MESIRVFFFSWLHHCLNCQETQGRQSITLIHVGENGSDLKDSVSLRRFGQHPGGRGHSD